jgi:hypothetical protein
MKNLISLKKSKPKIPKLVSSMLSLAILIQEEMNAKLKHWVEVLLISNAESKGQNFPVAKNKE